MKCWLLLGCATCQLAAAFTTRRSSSAGLIHAWATQSTNSRPRTFQLNEKVYGKGADIWPPTNEAIVDLRDSFPNGELPLTVVNQFQAENDLLEEETNNLPLSTGEQKKRWQILPRRVGRILRRAARQEERDEFALQPIDKIPLLVALACFWLVHPIDILFVVFISGYTCLLVAWSKMPCETGIPSLPALPPQGHVPDMISNPLGYDLTHAPLYRQWLKTGILLGLAAPLAWVYYHQFGPGTLDASLAGRPLFLLACQALSESIARRYSVFTPLPIRILIPLVYNTARLTYLWKFSFAHGLGHTGKLIAGSNLFYWSINLFGFLIPVATMKYLRAHFFCVEAQQVVIHSGMERNVGMTPYYPNADEVPTAAY